MSRNKDITKFGRRQFMKSLAGFGVSTETLQHLTKDRFDGLVTDIKKEVPYVAYWRATEDPESGRAMKPIYDTVPRDLWVVTRGTEKAAKRVRNHLERSINTHQVSVHPSDAGSGDPYDRVVKVDYVISRSNSMSDEGPMATPNVAREEIERLLPETVSIEIESTEHNKVWQVDDIPVVFERKEYYRYGGCKKWWYNDDHGSSIPGGSKIKVSKALDADPGTFGTPAYDQNRDERIMVTAGHLFDDTGDDGDWAWQPHVSNSDKDGTVYKQKHAESLSSGSNDDDYALLHAPSGETGSDFYNYKLANDSGGTRAGEIWGYVSHETIEYDHGDSSETYYKQGARTGLTSGYVSDYDTNLNNYIETTAEGYHGDSGGPIFKELSGPEYYIASVVHGGTGSSCPGSGTAGTTMQRIMSQNNLRIGTAL